MNRAVCNERIKTDVCNEFMSFYLFDQGAWYDFGCFRTILGLTHIQKQRHIF